MQTIFSACACEGAERPGVASSSTFQAARLGVAIQRLSPDNTWVSISGGNRVNPLESLRIVVSNVNEDPHITVTGPTGELVLAVDANRSLFSGEADYVWQAPSDPGRYHVHASGASNVFASLLPGGLGEDSGDSSFVVAATRVEAPVEPPIAGPKGGSILGNVKSLGILAAVIAAIVVLGPILGRAVGERRSS